MQQWLPGIYPTDLKMYVHTKSCTWILITTLFIISRTHRQPRCSLVGELIKKLCISVTGAWFSRLFCACLSHNSPWLPTLTGWGACKTAMEILLTEIISQKRRWTETISNICLGSARTVAPFLLHLISNCCLTYTYDGIKLVIESINAKG